MQHLRKELRKYHVKRQGMERDAEGRASQKAIWFDCPFCGIEVKARVWSLCGRGKRCGCDALFTENTAVKLVAADEALNAGVNFAMRETHDSRPGRLNMGTFIPGPYFQQEAEVPNRHTPSK